MYNKTTLQILNKKLEAICTQYCTCGNHTDIIILIVTTEEYKILRLK